LKDTSRSRIPQFIKDQLSDVKGRGSSRIITVTIDPQLLAESDIVASALGLSRSRFFREALEFYIHHLIAVEVDHGA